jgi:RNA polymerase sigma factor FliA
VSAGAVLKRIELEPPCPESPRPGPKYAEPAPAQDGAPRASNRAAAPSEQREQLLLEHLAQVHHIARRIHDRLPPQVPLEDLVHAGILGLMDAVRKYDPSKNVLLKHYAEFRIRGAILDSLRQVDWSPRTLRRQAKRVEQARLVCRARLGRDPSEPEIADEVGMSLARLQRILGEVRGLDVSSLHSETEELNGEDAIDPPTAAEEDPFHQALRSEMASLLERAISELAARERDVLALYHFEELTMKQVGAILGIGESRVSQIHSAALLRLRARLRQLTEKAPGAHPVPQKIPAASLRKFA